MIVYYIVCLNKHQLGKLLQRVQNAAARLVVTKDKLCNITFLHLQLQWLPVLFHINVKILLLTFKAIHGLAPPYINDLSVKGKPLTRYGLRSDSGILLSHPNFKTSTTLGNRASAPKLWNNLSSKIKIATPVNHFKKPLTTYLLSKAFS